MQLPVVCGNYQFELPMGFYPDYSKHGAARGDYDYDFAYEVKILTKQRIMRLSLPEHGEITE